MITANIRTVFALIRKNMCVVYPCLCLCFGVLQTTKRRLPRRTTLHLLHIGFTEEHTFIRLTYDLPLSVVSYSLLTILPRTQSGESSRSTRSPGTIRM